MRLSPRLKDLAVSGLAVALLATAVGTANATLLTGLEGYWPLNGNGVDASGNGRDLSFAGNPSFGQGQLKWPCSQP